MEEEEGNREKKMRARGRVDGKGEDRREREKEVGRHGRRERYPLTHPLRYP